MNDGGPAFPRPGFLSTTEEPHEIIAEFENLPESGMTLRDYFAAKAMQAFITGQHVVIASCANSHTRRALDELSGQILKAPHAAYKIADEMLKAREALE